MCPLIQFWTFAYLSWILALFFPWDVFQIMNMSPSRGSFSISCPVTRMMVEVKWLDLSTYITLFSWFMSKMSLLTNMPVCCLHTHFVNLHFIGCSTYQKIPCTHVSTSMILLKTLSIILIQTILTKIYYNNGGLHMNPLLIFGSAPMTCSFKLQRARWNFLIFGTGSSIVLRNLPIPRESLRSSLAQPSWLIELCNLMLGWALSQLTVHLPLIQQLHHCPVMLRIMFVHLFNFHTLPTSLHSIVMQIWLWVLQVLIGFLFYDICLRTQVFL